MRNINYSGRAMISNICVILVLWPLSLHAAMLPPDPDNAALLYYQAFLLRPEPDTNTFASIDEVLRGGEPDEKLREYLNLRDCRKTIEFTKSASQMPHCNWGIIFSQGFNYYLGQFEHLNCLTSLLYLDVRILASDEDYRAALDRCLTIRRIANHTGDDATILYASSLSFDILSQCCIQDVLGDMQLDSKILTWLQSQLAAVQGASQSPARALEMDFELAIQTLRTDTDTLAWLREQLAESTEDAQNLTKEEIVDRAQEPYANFLNSALQVINSDIPYVEKHTELQGLTYKLEEEFGSNPAANQIIMACAEQVTKLYDLQLRHTARSNALKAAIEIYLATAKSGRLPETLPDYLPQDPYSNQNFEYEITDDGFILRCRIKPIGEHEVRQYEFKVQK